MTDADLKFALVALSAVFFVIDPLANVPLFLTITRGFTVAQRRSVALRAAFATWLILSIFALAGGLIFQAFGISLGAFKIARGRDRHGSRRRCGRSRRARARREEQEGQPGSHGREHDTPGGVKSVT